MKVTHVRVRERCDQHVTVDCQTMQVKKLYAVSLETSICFLSAKRQGAQGATQSSSPALALQPVAQYNF